MKYSILWLFFIIVFSRSFASCRQSENTTSSNESPLNLTKEHPKDWGLALQKTTSFKEETELLKTLIQVDSTNAYEQLIANRLQTFDLRHLKEKEKLAIIDLYELSLQPARQLSNNTLHTAYAKLNAVYPTNNQLVDEKIIKITTLIKEKVGADLEF